MCNFCNNPFDLILIRGDFKENSQDSILSEKEKERLTMWREDSPYEGDYLFKDRDKFGIYVDTGNMQPGILDNIRFCPYCGRDLIQFNSTDLP